MSTLLGMETSTPFGNTLLSTTLTALLVSGALVELGPLDTSAELDALCWLPIMFYHMYTLLE